MLTSEQIKNKFKKIRPDLKPIDTAPNRGDLEAEANKLGVHVDTLIAREREVKYKACDSDGNVFLVMNPAAWPETLNHQGRLQRHRPPPCRIDDSGSYGTKRGMDGKLF